MIACIRVPYFAAAVERRDDSRLLKHPLVIGGQHWEVKPVYATSAETIPFGVNRGLPLREAHSLCPTGVFLPTAERSYRHSAVEINDLLNLFSDRIEPRWTYPSIVYYVACYDEKRQPLIRFGMELGRAVRRESGLHASIGIGANKFLSYAAAKQTQIDRLRLISDAEQATFLANMPLAAYNLDPKMRHRLELFGIRTFGQLAQLPSDGVQNNLGMAGQRLQQVARGHDPRPVEPVPDQVSEMVQLPFDEPVISLAPIQAQLDQIAEQWAMHLTHNQLATQKLLLWVEQENGERQTPYVRLSDPVQASKTLREQLQRLLARCTFASGVVELKVTMSRFVPVEANQLNLFDFIQTPATDALDEVVADLTEAYGSELFVRGRAVAPDSPLLERRYKWVKVAGQKNTAIIRPQEANEIRVLRDANGDFDRFVWRNRTHEIKTIHKCWSIETGWWSQRIERDYYKVTTDNGHLLVIYGDLLTERWFVYRVYD